jgi:integrase/transposase
MITAAFVRECKPRATMYEVTCDALPGFILRVLPTGKKVALVRYRVDGKDHRVKIGLLGPALPIEEARRRAALMLADVAIDESADEPAGPPAAVRRARLKQVEPEKSQVVPLRELAERFVRTYVDVYLKPGTAERYRHQLKTIILPGLADKEKKIPPLGDRDFRTIKRADVQELHGQMKDRPGAANNMVMVFASLYARIIEDWEIAPDMRNPAHGCMLYPMPKRERFLTPEERQRLHAVVQAGLKIPAGRRGNIKIQSVWALELLALTGRRRDELLTLTWPMIDWQHSMMNLPDTKGGQLKVPVSGRVLALLKHIHEQASRPRTGYVLRTDKGTRLTSVNGTWYRIRKAADLMDVRLHDLRHSFASDALMSGVPLATVGKLLGHKQARSTERYAHLANDVIRQGLEQATSRIVEAVTPVAALPPAPFKAMSDKQWKAIAAIVESTRGTGGGPRTDLRQIVDGIRWVLHTGAKWREIPGEYGKATTAWRWYERWCSDGTWQQIAATLELARAEVGREPGRRPVGSKSRRRTPIDVDLVETSAPL